jgi:hypothetical protein
MTGHCGCGHILGEEDVKESKREKHPVSLTKDLNSESWLFDGG